MLRRAQPTLHIITVKYYNYECKYLDAIYQLPLILTALLHVACKTLSISRHVPLSGHDDVALFE